MSLFSFSFSSIVATLFIHTIITSKSNSSRKIQVGTKYLSWVGVLSINLHDVTMTMKMIYRLRSLEKYITIRKTFNINFELIC